MEKYHNYLHSDTDVIRLHTGAREWRSTVSAVDLCCNTDTKPTTIPIQLINDTHSINQSINKNILKWPK